MTEIPIQELHWRVTLDGSDVALMNLQVRAHSQEEAIEVVRHLIERKGLLAMFSPALIPDSLKEPEEAEVVSETPPEAPVEDFRTERFKELGFNEDDAQALSESKVDIRKVMKYIEGGCPHETAKRILLP